MHGRLSTAGVAWVLVCSGCYRTAVTTKNVVERRHERRVPVSVTEPIWRSSWHTEQDAIVGQLDVQECQTSRAWTSSQLKITQRTPFHAAGWAFVGLGSVSAFVGAATWKSEPTQRCDGLYSCGYEQPDNTLAQVMVGTSLVFGTVGLVMLVESEGTTTEVVSRKDHSASVKESCFTADDLAELLVVLRDDAGHVWPVRLASTGEARIALPQSPDVPRGTKLKLVVYRAPRFSGGLYTRGLVLETLELP